MRGRVGQCIIALGCGSLLLAAGLGCGGCASSHADDRWWGQDKAQHLGASAAIGWGGTFAALKTDAGDAPAFVAGVGVSLTAGFLKEEYDVRVKRSYWSWRDVVWDVVGAVAGSLLALEMEH